MTETWVTEQSRANWPTAARWAGVIALSGLVIPYLAIWITLPFVWAIDADGSEVGRLMGLLLPPSHHWSGILHQLALQWPPFLIQALTALFWLARTPPGSATKRVQWRIGGCFVGLALATVLSHAIVAPLHAAWVRPGFDEPVVLFLAYYGGGLVLGLVGRAVGKRMARTHVHGDRARRSHGAETSMESVDDDWRGPCAPRKKTI